MSFSDLFKDQPLEIKALSHSRMSTYFKCPRMAKYKFIDKLREPDSIHTARGTDIHKDIELYIKGESESLSEVVARSITCSAFIDQLRTMGVGETELQLAFDADWKPVSWFDPRVFMRVVLDYVLFENDVDIPSVLVVDHKTGKVYPEHDEQSELYAVAAFHQWPEAHFVDIRYTYIDQDFVEAKSYSRLDDFERLQDRVMARANIITSDRVFPTKPSGKCNWCHFRRSNQGPCDHG